MTSSGRIRSRDVMDEGFTPLARVPTEPVALPSKHLPSKRMSFNAETGEAEAAQGLWEHASWTRLEKLKGKVLEQTNSFVGTRTRKPTEEVLAAREVLAVAVVDPFSTGAHLAAAADRLGYKVLRVLSIWDSPVAALVQDGVAVDYAATVQHNDQMTDANAALKETMNALRSLPYRLVAVVAGAETGVELADALSEGLGLRSNGTAGSICRRNKYHMGERVRAAGVRAVKQKLCRSLQEVHSFLDELTVKPLKCVVKPVQSAGTDDVFLCSNREEAVTAFSRINGKRNGLGLINDGALVQEFLSGKEYVIDKVSRDGEHKLVAIWEYDKRPVNGANFVYFGMRLQDPNLEKCRKMSAYADSVLDALGINQGPSHMEVMWCEDGVCLVEVGSRCHGGEGTWIPIAQECVGYTQVSLTVDVFTGGHLFDEIPKDIYKVKKFGAEVDFVSRHSGILRGYPGEKYIRSLPSFRSISWEHQPGDFCPLTIDCFTRPGCAQIVHESIEQLNEDFESVHDLEEMGLIDYALICPVPPVIGAVVIVDPFSTGANLAALVAKWGYKLILVFSEKDSPVASLVATGANLKPTLLVQHDGARADKVSALNETLKAIRDHSASAPILAILPGAETGVELAEALSARFGTRCNGEQHIGMRRNKWNMQEGVRAAGVRACSQKLCRSEKEVTLFWEQLQSANRVPVMCVVKPNASAGSDGVHLCDSLDATLNAFHMVNGVINGLGNVNDGALLQEYLQGKEYVIDGVSRDGHYKVIAVWEYDKRPANGAAFVYYGMQLKSTIGKVERELIDYSAQVVKALHINQGPSHMEVIMTSSGPCLVEVGCRCHGGEATWLPIAEECIGYSQLDATLSCYLRPDAFDTLPSEYGELKAEGAEVHLVSKVSGTLMDIPGLETIRAMPSFRRLDMHTQVGSRVHVTVDCFTRPGSFQLVHKLRYQLEADIEAIRALESKGLLEIA